MTARIKNVITEAVSLFSKDGIIPIDDIETFGNHVNSTCEELYRSHKIDNQVLFYCSFFKWIDEDERTISRKDAESWENAEELNVMMVIRRRTRKKNPEHQKLIEKCFNTIRNAIDTSLFYDEELEIINHVSTGYPITGKNSYETLGEIAFKKPNFKENHPTHC